MFKSIVSDKDFSRVGWRKRERERERMRERERERESKICGHLFCETNRLMQTSKQINGNRP